MEFGGLVRFEWLLFEFAVVGWAGWELWSLRRDRRRPARAKPEEAKSGGAKPGGAKPGDADPPHTTGG